VVVVGGAIIFTGGTAAAGVAALTKKIGTGAIVTGSALVLGQGLADGFITGTESGFGAFFNAAMRGIAIGVVAGAVSAIPIKGKFISTKAASHISANLSGMAGSATSQLLDGKEFNIAKMGASGLFAGAVSSLTKVLPSARGALDGVRKARAENNVVNVAARRGLARQANTKFMDSPTADVIAGITDKGVQAFAKEALYLRDTSNTEGKNGTL